KAPFQRLIYKILHDIPYYRQFRIQSAILFVLLLSSIVIITNILGSNLYVIHAKRVTIIKKDMELVRTLG
ncbi:hypothetical protein B0T25DRAFT_467210, partial [Lasiosphaeria hispida]